MAVGNLGVSFLESGNDIRKRKPIDEMGGQRMGNALQVLSFALPRILGRGSFAPAPLLRSQGAATPGLGAGLGPSQSFAGPRPADTMANSIASAVVQQILSRSGRTGVGGGGGDILTQLSSQVGQPSLPTQEPSGAPGAPSPAAPQPEPEPTPGPGIPIPPRITGQEAPAEPKPTYEVPQFSYDDFDQEGYQAEQARRQEAGEEPISPYEYRYPGVY